MMRIIIFEIIINDTRKKSGNKIKEVRKENIIGDNLFQADSWKQFIMIFRLCMRVAHCIENLLN